MEAETEKLNKLIQYREHFRKFHEFEDSLINQRITYLLTSQSILLVPHFLILTNKNIKLSFLPGNVSLFDLNFSDFNQIFPKFIILFLMITFGIFLCELIQAAIDTAYRVKDTFEEQWKKLIEEEGLKDVKQYDYLPNLMFHIEKKKKEAIDAIKEEKEKTIEKTKEESYPHNIYNNWKKLRVKRTFLFYRISRAFQVFWLFLLVFDIAILIHW